MGIDQHSVHAVAIIKNKIDTANPFYIHKINDQKWNNCGTYVFKSSQTAAEIGLVMDRTARQTSLRELVVHMDGIHYIYIMGKKSNIIDNISPHMHGV